MTSKPSMTSRPSTFSKPTSTSTATMTPKPSMTSRPSTFSKPTSTATMTPKPSMTSRPSITSKPTYCILNDKRYPNMWYGMIDRCTLCKCDNTIMKCQKKCSDTIPGTETTNPPSSGNSDEVGNPITDIQSCLKIPRNYLSDLHYTRCIKTPIVNGFACCKNKNKCSSSIQNCVSCINSKCIECFKGYTLFNKKNAQICIDNKLFNGEKTEQPNMDDKNVTNVNNTHIPENTKTPETTETTETTETYDSFDPTDLINKYKDKLQTLCDKNEIIINDEFKLICKKCLNGKVLNNTCVCKDDFIGDFCEVNCRRSLCSGHGTCNIMERKCKCDQTYYGDHCNLKRDSSIICRNGVFNDEKQKCECNYGFMGRLCDIHIPCVNGEIYDDKCVCNDGFSGKDCSIPRPLPISMRLENEIIRNSTITIKKNCLHGFLINNNCYCHLGWGGETCNELMCKNGLMNITSNECICNRGWSGNKCDIHCLQPCNNKGSICNNERICKCNYGWNGLYCENRKIVNKTTTISISDIKLTIDIEQVKENRNIDMKLIECLDYSCIPFELNIQPKENYTIQNRLRRMNDLNNEITMVLDNTLVPQDKSLFVYDKYDINVNHTFDSNIISVGSAQDRSYLFNVINRQVDIMPQATSVPRENPIPIAYPSLTSSPSPSNKDKPDSSNIDTNNDGTATTPTETTDNVEDQTNNDNGNFVTSIITPNQNYFIFGGIGFILCVSLIIYLKRNHDSKKNKIRRNISNSNHIDNESLEQQNIINPLYNNNNK